MAKHIDPSALRALEEEARKAEQADDLAGALDIYEEIDRNGWATAGHLTALGYCYLKNRQKHDARETWLRAFSLDPQYGPSHEALDKYFPGWEKQAPTPAATVPPPPPPPPRFAASQSAELTVETTSTIALTAAQTKPFAAEQAPEIKAKSEPLRPAPRERATEPAGRAKPDFNEGRVNWTYALGDAAEEAAAYAR